MNVIISTDDSKSTPVVTVEVYKDSTIGPEFDSIDQAIEWAETNGHNILNLHDLNEDRSNNPIEELRILVICKNLNISRETYIERLFAGDEAQAEAIRQMDLRTNTLMEA